MTTNTWLMLIYVVCSYVLLVVLATIWQQHTWKRDDNERLEYCKLIARQKPGTTGAHWAQYQIDDILEQRKRK